jgi:isopenicillin N synthase-like dioxygenase
VILFLFGLLSIGFRRVAKSVARIIALALNLDADFFDRPEMLGDPIATLRLLHYEGGRETGHAFV